MANFMGLKRLLLLHYFPNHFIILKTTPVSPQLQTSLVTQQKRLLNTDSETVTHVSSFTVKYLTKSCGLPLEQALSASQKFRLKENESHKHQSVLSLLRSFHFSHTHITKLLIKCPQILQSKVHNNLQPKLQFLTDYGFAGKLLPDLVALNPYILCTSLSNSIKPTIEFLEKYVQTNDKVVAAVKRYPKLMTFDLKGIMQPNINFLLSEGVTAATMGKLIVRQPMALMMKLDKIVNAVETVKELGLNPSAPMSAEAIRVILSMSNSTWESKVQMFKSFGWSEEEIMSAFKRDPTSFTCSVEKIRSLMDFYLNTMKLDPAVIASCPKFLKFGLSARIRPRYNIIKVLVSKKLLKEDGKHHWLFTRSEKQFMTRIVDKHLDQVPNLMELYCGTITGDKIDIQLH